jgi:hypothetical protein
VKKSAAIVIGRTNISEAAIRFAIADNICFIDDLPEPEPAVYSEYKLSNSNNPGEQDHITRRRVEAERQNVRSAAFGTYR